MQNATYIWKLKDSYTHNKEKAMVPHSNTLAWKIPWTEEPGRLQSMGLWRVRNDWVTSFSLFYFHALEKEMTTHSSVLAWRIPGTGEPGGLPSMGWRRVGHNWSELAAAAAAAFAESCFSRTKPMLSKLMLRDIFKTHLFSKISLTIVINSDHTILFNEKIHYVDPFLIMTWLKWGAVKKN